MDAAARRALKVRNSRLQLDSPDRIEHLTIYTRICRAEKYQRQALRLGPEWNSGGTSCSLSSKIQNTGRRFPFSPDRNDSPFLYVCVYIHTHGRDTRVVEISLLVEGIYIQEYIGIENASRVPHLEFDSFRVFVFATRAGGKERKGIRCLLTFRGS